MITVRRAVASEAKPLIGLYAESGRGKTTGALLVAKGFAGDMKHVVMIETEAGRGEAHADDPVLGGYSVISLREEFSPTIYGEAISLAEKEGAQVFIIDSASHEWEGLGGVLEMIDKNKAAGKKGVAASMQPKMQHNREFMLRVTQTPIAVVIVCMRAKYPMYEVTQKHLELWEAAGKPGKAPRLGEWARSWQLEPKQSEDILSEMFVHGWIDEDHVFHGTKYTKDILRQALITGEPLSVESGKRLALWAAGKLSEALVTADQIAEIRRECEARDVKIEKLLERASIEKIELLLAARFAGALKWLKTHTPTKPVDEGSILASIDKAADRDAAALILDGVRGQPYYASVSEAFANRWGASA